MVDFSTVDSLTIPEGPVASIQVDGRIIWRRRYDRMSHGDGVATDHTSNDI